MSKGFNELTRVQMPAMVHLTRLGYSYIGKIQEESANVVYDPETNILINVFTECFKKLNPDSSINPADVLKQISKELDNDDLGRSFYKTLKSVTPFKIIDFDNPYNNVFHCTGEFTYKKDNEEFRPDLTLFINGLPLVFVEVKKPNNAGGMVAESRRMNDLRFPNKKFRKFINLTQFMIFSNNMEYDTDGGIVPIQGAFYCTSARTNAPFNCFREENPLNYEIAPYNYKYPYSDVDQEIEKRILNDYNCQVIRHSKEYQQNLGINTPTNRILTSMCSPERILYIIRYGLAYVKQEKEIDGKIHSIDEKHIMRYQQLFATLAIQNKLNEGVKSGIIWHTQGSGKTALSYYLVPILTDYYSNLNIVPKFYFIVDRLDLLRQAAEEFEARGLVVKTANGRRELMKQFRNYNAIEGDSGQAEITVINIQKFDNDHDRINLPPYETNLQRIFIVDEAHRGYNPKGSFLANLLNADDNAIKFALTGTPLLKEERASWKVFGDYIHTYYYDKSIQDGYTLKILREDIETSYKEKLSQIYEKIDNLVLKKDVKRSDIIEHEVYVKELLRYIIDDLNRFRIIHGDSSLGAMVICDTGSQAKALFKYFTDVQNEINEGSSHPSNFKAGLILHDYEDKSFRYDVIKDFKKNMTIDILFVFNMLLTGFDAPRLKRLYVGRKLKDHNLLQAITRVNRPYKNNRYGYIIDFADIKQNFDETNEAYIRELNRFNIPEEIGADVETNTLNCVIEDRDAVIEQLKDVRQVLFNYSTDNLESFSSEISTLEDKSELIRLRNILTQARDCFNIVRSFGDKELKDYFEKLSIPNLPEMISEVNHAINMINQREAFENDDLTRQLVNEAMMDISFSFNKIGEDELELVSGREDLDSKLHKVGYYFADNLDQDDPEYITIYEAFRQRFKEKGFVVDSMAQYNEFAKDLDEIAYKLISLQKENKKLTSKYNGDVKFARIHKRIREENQKRQTEGKGLILSNYDEDIVEMLNSIKREIDQQVYDRNDILKKDAYFEKTVMSLVSRALDNLSLRSAREDRVFIQKRIAKQYLDQYNDFYYAA